MGGVVPFGVVACVQEVAVTPDELLAGADLIHYTMGARKCGVRNGECGMQNSLAQPMPWLAYAQGGNRKASDGRLVRPTLRSALLGLEIGTSQSILPVGAGRFGRTPHIALSGTFLALRASECNGWPRRWVSGRRRDWDPGSGCSLKKQFNPLSTRKDAKRPSIRNTFGSTPRSSGCAIGITRRGCRPQRCALVDLRGSLFGVHFRHELRAT